MMCRSHARILALLIVCAILLPTGACRPNYAPHTGNEGYSGPSSGIAAAGPSTTWVSGQPNAPELNWLAAVNAQRNAAGVQSLAFHPGLWAVAQAHSTDMALRNYVNLITPDGYDVFQSLVAANPPMSFDNAFAFVAAVPNPNPAIPSMLATFMSDPAIAAGLLDPTMTHFGIWGATGPPGAGTFAFDTIILARNITP